MIIENKSKTKYEYELPDGATDTRNVESNPTRTENVTAAFTKVKTSNKTYLQEGETALQTVVLTNNSNYTIEQPTFHDIMTGDASYVGGSVRINGLPRPNYDPATGFTLPELAPGESVKIKYRIKAGGAISDGEIKNRGCVSYLAQNVGIVEFTNFVIIQLIKTKITVEKTVDKAVAFAGSVLRYTSKITNDGNITKTNVFFSDPIPGGTTFRTGSVKIDGVSKPAHNPSDGFALPDMQAGAVVTVEFEVTVN